MSFEPSSGYAPPSNLQDINDPSLPIFDVQKVSLQFTAAADFVAAQVSNNVLILALSTGRILRIDLERPQDIDDIDLPKKPTEVGVVRRMFLDPTASHLIINTTLGENYYLHSQSRQPKPLSRLKGVSIECISWNPSQPTASTREILLGVSDGSVWESYIETTTEFYRREEKYLKNVYKAPDGPVTGIWTDNVSGKPDVRRVLVATGTTLRHFVGRVGRHGHEGSGSIFSRFFESEGPTEYDVPNPASASSTLAVSPEPMEGHVPDAAASERVFAWLNAQGVFHGPLLASSDLSSLGTDVYGASKMLPRSKIPPSMSSTGRPRASTDPASSMILSQWHIIQLVEGRVVCINRLDSTVVHDQIVLEPGRTPLGLVEDLKKNTFWLFTAQEILEIAVTEESRDIWKIMLKQQQFDAASQFAKTPTQKDAVATASGDYLVKKGQFMEAAAVYGRSSKAFEEVALTFIDNSEQDALRKYLSTKLSMLKKSAIMQRIMLASWLVELYMAKLNTLDDTITTQAELAEGMNTAESRSQLSIVRREFQEFATKYKNDLDRKTTYEVISNHGREEELLFFANVIDDYNYVLSYWVQRERWQESLTVLKKQTDPEIFYKYSTVLMAAAARELIDILMRQSNLQARKLIPALLSYDKRAREREVPIPLSQNQAVRYLNFAITTQQSTDAVVHNTLISIYASHPSKDEGALLGYLRAQSMANEQLYDADFALRLCISHKRVQSCVHIYTTMGKYKEAVDLALQHDEIELAASVADRPEINTPQTQALRKKLWLAVAKKVIAQASGIKAAMEFLKRCELLRIEDLIPFFPDFVVIDDFKDEICAALESYSKHIDSLKREMDDSARTATHIQADIRKLDQRYAIVEPGEMCYQCRLPLLARQFYVFPCQHAFHADCCAKRVLEIAGKGTARRIREMQAEVSRGTKAGKEREELIKELDRLVAGACVLCSDLAVKQIDEPFVLPADNQAEWAL